jgi:hypothetical protein
LKKKYIKELINNTFQFEKSKNKSPCEIYEDENDRLENNNNNKENNSNCLDQLRFKEDIREEKYKDKNNYNMNIENKLRETFLNINPNIKYNKENTTFEDRPEFSLETFLKKFGESYVKLNLSQSY